MAWSTPAPTLTSPGSGATNRPQRPLLVTKSSKLQLVGCSALGNKTPKTDAGTTTCGRTATRQQHALRLLCHVCVQPWCMPHCPARNEPSCSRRPMLHRQTMLRACSSIIWCTLAFQECQEISFSAHRQLPLSNPVVSTHLKECRWFSSHLQQRTYKGLPSRRAGQP